MSTGRVVLVGEVHEALPVLEALLSDEHVDVVGVLTCTRAGARLRSGVVDVARLADGAGVPVLRSDDAGTAAAVEWVRSRGPDLLVIAGWHQDVGTGPGEIGPELLTVPRRGCVSFHASLLPRHRGHAAVNWAILRGETEIGTTLVMLEPGTDADTGDIVAQVAIPIGADATVASVYADVGRAGALLLRENLPALLAGTAPRRSQRDEEGDVLPRRTPEMGVIDWNRTPREVHDWVRALTAPFPGAWTRVEGRTVMVWATRPADPLGPVGRPGEILGLLPDGLLVAVRGGNVVLTRMSDAGEHPQHARRWFRRSRLALHTVFDPVPPEVAEWARTGGDPAMNA